MAHAPRQTVLRHLRRLVGGPGAEGPTDRQLLERFVAGRDEDAFAALVRRHGPLVWGVCRGRLRHAQDAEDCFQATFLVLARKAGSVRWRESVASWLHAVAGRVAAEARARNARLRARERLGLAADPPAPEPAGRELCAALDEELRGLPEKYRAPLLACYLEGRTTDQAARQLGWSQRTLERRLAQGRARLRARLVRRGLTLSGALLTAALSGESARAALPAGLAAATTRAALAPGVGESPAALALAENVLKGITMRKTHLVTALLFLLGAAAGGTGALLVRAGAPPQPAAEAPSAEAKSAAATKEEPADVARRVWAILEVVRHNHVEPPPRQQMVLGAARGLLKAADVAPPDDLPRRAADVADEGQLRAFLREIWPGGRPGKTPEDEKLEAGLLEGLLASIPGKPDLVPADILKGLEQGAANRYMGVGIQIGINEAEKVPQITIPIRRGPARRAGAKPGDLLLEVNGKNTRGAALRQVVAWVRGEAGTPVTLVVRQPGAAATRTLKMTRGVVPFETVLGFRRVGEEGWDFRIDPEAGIGYVWVESLKSSTLHELRQIERRLQAEHVRALVLDFRFSAGEGMPEHAALVADGLLDGGLMWTARGPGGEVREYRADRECLFRGWPMVVLINGMPDSAQGAIAAALQDNHRAPLVGEPTTSDGSVRTIVHLPGSGDGITVLTGRLERAAKGRGWPVRPDREVPLTKGQRAAVEKWFRDKNLPELPSGTDDRPPDDPQLAAALELLRDQMKPAGQK
jgi:C-terminal peptidase prc